jgi:hypothetical protein
VKTSAGYETQWLVCSASYELGRIDRNSLNGEPPDDLLNGAAFFFLARRKHVPLGTIRDYQKGCRGDRPLQQPDQLALANVRPLESSSSKSNRPLNRRFAAGQILDSAYHLPERMSALRETIACFGVVSAAADRTQDVAEKDAQFCSLWTHF